jgi:hypothetical protein
MNVRRLLAGQQAHLIVREYSRPPGGIVALPM